MHTFPWLGILCEEGSYTACWVKMEVAADIGILAHVSQFFEATYGKYASAPPAHSSTHG